MLQQSENCKLESPAINANTSFYKEFCDHLHEIESKKKLLIKPDFMDNQESKEMLSENKVLQKQKESVKPLIEVISNCPTTSEEQSSEQKEIKQSHRLQTISHCQQTEVSIIVIYICKLVLYIHVSIKIILYVKLFLLLIHKNFWYD